MPRLLQIDTCLGILSTGRITEGIGEIATAMGWECYVAHGARYVGESNMSSYQIGTKIGEYFHYAQSLLCDRHGLGSIRATKRLIKKIEMDIKPDIIHLHCVHGYYLNYKILFEYLNSKNIPVVWTFHDCWAFTGHCAHFITSGCDKWKNGCNNCPLLSEYPKSLIDNSTNNYIKKKKLFSSNDNLHIVAVSSWMKNLVDSSFLSGKDIRVINNGVDLNRFAPVEHNLTSKLLLGVASSWNNAKGLSDFYSIRESLPEDYEILLVGLTDKQIKALPNGIKGITRTESIEQLAELYSKAMVLVNPTYADTFPTVNIEALACGTPVITYNTGGSPEVIDSQTGIVVEQGDIDGIVNAIMTIHKNPISSVKCRERAVKYFNKDERFWDYIHLYEELIYVKDE